MRCLVASCFGLGLMAAVCGCRSCHRVEAELRSREEEVRELRDEMDRTTVINQSLQQEVRSLRGELGLGPDGLPPAAYPVRSLVLGRLTGGRCNSDSCPGDDALQVQVEPRDAEGQPIKAPGALAVQVVEISKEGLKRPLSSWEIPPDKLRRSWRVGMLTGSAYVVTLPWKVWPASQKLRVTATFQMPDGRVFEADREVTIRLTPENLRPRIVPDSGPVPPTPLPVLPPPRAVDPSKVWQKVDPPPLPPVGEILLPIPLKDGK